MLFILTSSPLLFLNMSETVLCQHKVSTLNFSSVFRISKVTHEGLCAVKDIQTPRKHQILLCTFILH